MANSYTDWQGFPLAEQVAHPTVGDFMTSPTAQAPAAQSLGTAPQGTTVGAFMVGAAQAPAAQDLGIAPPIPGITPGPSYDTNLGMTRTRFATEMQQNPDLRRKLMASMTAEVGDQGEPAQQAYLETVMNRAAARGVSLDATISNPHYYPTSTTSKLGATFSQDQAAKLNPLINNALSGSNISNFATGNESGKLRSGAVTFDPSPGSKTGERFVIEDPDKRWVTGFTRIAQQTPTPAPTPSRKLTWQELIATSPSLAGT